MKIAVSACLLGEACRYDGQSRPCEAVKALAKAHELVPVCPERAGGLEAPRLPCEVVVAERMPRVVDAQGADRTQAFLDGAQRTLDLVQQEGCRLAILKSNSPSCGSALLYDGTFSGTLVPGYGVTARLLRAEGVRVLDEVRLQALLATSAARHPGVPPAIFAETAASCPVLETERLVLRPLSLADEADVFAYCSDPDIGADAGWPVHRTLADARAFIEMVASAPHVYGIFEKKASDSLAMGPCIGSVGLIPDEQRKNVDGLMLGYALAKWVWGKGYMTEAAREVLRYGFEELGLGMATCTHYTFNSRSRRVIEKCGFAFEGTMRAVEATPDGTMRDWSTYSLAEDEWRALRTAAG